MDVFSGVDDNVMQYYPDVFEPPGSFRAASASVDNHEPLESQSESHFLVAYSLSDPDQFTNEIIPVPATVQVDPPVSTETSHYVNTEQSSEICISSICLQQRNRLIKRVHELSVENQNLLMNNTETRKRLVENELQLGLAQDSNSRLQVNFNSEIMTLRNTNWMLETEVNTLKSENRACKEMMKAMNSELVGIHEKINKLCELNFIGDRDQNASSFSQDNINHNNNFAASPNPCTEANCAIKQMKSKLDKAIQQNESILRCCVDEQLAQESQRAEKSFMDQDHEIESTEELHRQINYKLMDELQGQLSSNLYDTRSHGEEIIQPNNMNSSSQEIVNEALCGNANEYGMIYSNVEVDDRQPIDPISANLFQETETPSPEEDDDDITIITEIKRDKIKKPSTATDINQNVQSPPSSFISYHAMDYGRSGFTCTCGDIFSSLSKLDKHLRQLSPDGKLHCTDCDATFFSTPKLQLHMEEAHQVLVLDQCKTCGKVFKSRTELIRHEKSTHEYESLSTDSNPMDFVDELIDATGIIQQMNVTAKETTKTNRLAANPQSPLVCSAVDNETPVYTIGGKAPLSLSQPQNHSSHSHHRLDATRSLPGDYFWCICGSRYTKKTGLHQHIMSQTQPTNFICGTCTRNFSSFAGMKRHMEVHHGFSK